MANVLGTLFGDIANAIRGKTGEAGTMKPAEFPDKIAAIVTGGGSSASYTFKSGHFTAETGIQEIAHGCGEVPDIFVMYSPFAPEGGDIVIAVGFSQAMHDALGGGYIAPTTFLFPSGGASSINAAHGMETTSSAADSFGAPRDATRDTIKVGGTSVGLRVGGRYDYFCICGLV